MDGTSKVWKNGSNSTIDESSCFFLYLFPYIWYYTQATYVCILYALIWIRFYEPQAIYREHRNHFSFGYLNWTEDDTQSISALFEYTFTYVVYVELETIRDVLP